MATCTACGNQIPEGAQFCRHCGTHVGPPIVTDAPTTSPPPPGFAAAPVDPPNPTPKRRIGVLLIALLGATTIAMVALAIVVVARHHPASSSTAVAPETTIDLSKEPDVAVDTTSPIQSVSTTTIPAPVTTTIPPRDRAALRIAQSLATNLANHDWSAARLDPLFATTPDSDFTENFGGMTKSTVVLVRTTEIGPSLVNAEVGFVAWEDTRATPHTNLYCATWTIDLTLQRVTKNSAFHKLSTADIPGYVAPATQRSAIRSGC